MARSKPITYPERWDSPVDAEAIAHSYDVTVLAAAHRLIIGKIIRGAPIKDVERRAVVMALISQWLPKAEQRRIERALRLKRVEAHLLINAMMPVVSRTTIAETYGFASVEAMDKWRTRQKDRTKTR